MHLMTFSERTWAVGEWNGFLQMKMDPCLYGTLAFLLRKQFKKYMISPPLFSIPTPLYLVFRATSYGMIKPDRVGFQFVKKA